MPTPIPDEPVITGTDAVLMPTGVPVAPIVAPDTNPIPTVGAPIVYKFTRADCDQAKRIGVIAAQGASLAGVIAFVAPGTPPEGWVGLNVLGVHFARRRASLPDAGGSLYHTEGTWAWPDQIAALPVGLPTDSFPGPIAQTPTVGASPAVTGFI